MTPEKPRFVYGREREWSSLARFVCDDTGGASLGLVYGRRRQGKSFLLQAICEATGGFYHQALEQESGPALASLGADLGRFTGVPGAIGLRDWGEAVDSLIALGVGRGALPVVVDEFPYLVAVAPELPSIIQRALGSREATQGGSRTRLILCGSALSVMGRLLVGGAPLRGRANLELIVHGFDPVETAGFWGLSRKSELALKVHSVLGGTPAYKDLLRGDAPASSADFDAWIIRTVLDPANALFREGRYLMAEEPGVTDRALYHSILSAIASGSTRPGQIASVLGRPQTALAHPLNVLEDVGLVQREEDVLRQRRPAYRIAEPIMRFYHVIVRAHIARLERGGGKEIWDSEVQSTFPARVLGPHLEDLARWWTGLPGARETLGVDVAAVGPTVVTDPHGKATHQLDVVGVASRSGRAGPRVVVIGESKWRGADVGTDQVERLRHVCDLMGRRGIDATGARLVLFSSGGFNVALKRLERRGEVVLVDARRLLERGTGATASTVAGGGPAC